MNLKEQVKSVGFWAGIVGAIILVLGAFGVEIGDETANAVVNAVCSLMVFLGIASAPKTQTDVSEMPQIGVEPQADTSDENASGDGANSADKMGE